MHKYRVIFASAAAVVLLSGAAVFAEEYDSDSPEGQDERRPGTLQDGRRPGAMPERPPAGAMPRERKPGELGKDDEQDLGAGAQTRGNVDRRDDAEVTDEDLRAREAERDRFDERDQVYPYYRRRDDRGGPDPRALGY